MPENEAFTAQDIISDLYPSDTSEETVETESPKDAETEEEVLAGDESEETESPSPEEEEPTDTEEGDEYDKIKDPVKLRERLRSKDLGYAKQAHNIKTGQMVADALDPDNPKRAEAVDWLKGYLKIEEARPGDIPSVEFNLPAPPEDADEEVLAYHEGVKDHFETVLKPYVGQIVAKAVDSLRRELRSEIEEPLTEYRTSREKAAFEQRVDEEWKVTGKLANLQKIEATRDDLKAAMQEFKPLLDAKTHKPIDVLRLYKAGGKAPSAKPKESQPAMPKTGERTERKATADSAESVNDRIDRYFDNLAAK